ncbi:hypothetical protein FRB93_007616 [Tulasnella sp. JGI-2019a]|nr:hypothetical protein FRB93_007616 [Tulasnella sp. JGI-2019a]
MDLRGQSNGSFRRNNAPDLSMRVFSSPTAIHSSLRGESGGHALDSRSLTSPFVAADDEQTSDSPSQLIRQHLYAETITQEPSLNFSRATWWDHLLQTYAIRSAPYGTVTVARNLQDSSKEISQDVCRFFKVASIYLHFINVPLFFDMFHHTELRSSIQPAFIMSILAHSKLIEFYVRGGERDDEGECIWKQSIMLRELAQAAFDASYNADWIDLPLAQAAWILHWYEVGAHRDSTSARKEAALALLDNVIHVLNLTRVDAEDTRAPRFTAGAAPTLGRPDPVVPLPPTATTEFNPVVGCPCHALSLSRNPETARSTPAWSKMPGWGDNESEAEIRKEQARRLVWSAVVISAVISVTRLVDGYRQLDLHVARPENLAVMYPGEEALSREAKITTQYSGKESTCALLSRAALLLLACIQELPKIRAQTALPGSKEATLDLQVVTDFEVNAWVETSLIEDALDAHTCKIEQPVYQTRDYTLTVRLLLCGGFLQSMPPMPRTAPFARIDYDLAIQWLRHLADTMGQAFAVMMNNYDNSLRQHIASRPFLTSWTIAQMWRCVELWKLENSLTLALDVALDAVPLLRLFEATWPCSEERRHGARLIDELTSICALLGREAP